MEKPFKSLGEQLVRTEFNPDSNTTVDLIKQKSAELINLINEYRHRDARLVDQAITSYEVAAMWAVKAATA